MTSLVVQRVGDYKWCVGRLLESQTQGRVSSPPGATLMEYIFRLMEHSAENQFSFGNAQSTTKSARRCKTVKLREGWVISFINGAQGSSGGMKGAFSVHSIGYVLKRDSW